MAYNSDSLKKAKDIITLRKTSAEENANKRLLEIHLKSPEIKEIDEGFPKIGQKIVETVLLGKPKEETNAIIEEIKAESLALSAKRAEALKKLGYPEDYTATKYFCEKCSDTGYTNKGQTVCSCLREALIKESIAASGIGRLINEQSFDNFDVEWYRRNPDNYDRMRANLAAAKNYVKSFKNKRGNLLLIGTTGTGKTHISTAIARDLIHQGYDVLYDSAENVFSDFEQDRFRSGYGPYEPKAEKYLRADLLIIDDLGTELTNQFTLSCLYNLLNTRHNRGLATVISTNLTPDQLEMRYEDRISSRLIGRDTQILVFVGDDHRIG